MAIIVLFTRGFSFGAATAVQEWIAAQRLEWSDRDLIVSALPAGEPMLDSALDSAYLSVLVKKRLFDAGEVDASGYSAGKSFSGVATRLSARMPMPALARPFEILDSFVSVTKSQTLSLG
jgi:hypothetical protein